MSAKPCRGCGKPVVFAMDEEGKWQILDASAPIWKQVPSKDGKPHVMRDPKAMVSHFSTCRHANAFSASRAQSQPGPELHFSEPKEVEA